MFPISPVLIVIFLLIWIALGLALGWLTGVVMTWFLRKSKSKIIVDLVLGVVGCLTGVFVSGWASERTFNSGARRAYSIWDENGRAVDWRTALAEHQGLIAILGAILFVMCWHFAVVAHKKADEGSLK